MDWPVEIAGFWGLNPRELSAHEHRHVQTPDRVSLGVSATGPGGLHLARAAPAWTCRCRNARWTRCWSTASIRRLRSPLRNVEMVRREPRRPGGFGFRSQAGGALGAQHCLQGHHILCPCARRASASNRNQSQDRQECAGPGPSGEGVQASAVPRRRINAGANDRPSIEYPRETAPQCYGQVADVRALGREFS